MEREVKKAGKQSRNRQKSGAYSSASSGMGITNGKVSGKVGAWGRQKAPSGGPGSNAPGGGQGQSPLKLFNKNKT